MRENCFQARFSPLTGLGEHVSDASQDHGNASVENGRVILSCICHITWRCLKLDVFGSGDSRSEHPRPAVDRCL